LVPGGFLEDAAEWVETLCVSCHFAQHPLAAVFRHHAQKLEVEVQFLQTLPYLKHKTVRKEFYEVSIYFLKSFFFWKRVVRISTMPLVI
jgi:hypothetical protein